MEEIIRESLLENDSSTSPTMILMNHQNRRLRVSSSREDFADEQNNNDNNDFENDVQFAYGCSFVMILLCAASKLLSIRSSRPLNNNHDNIRRDSLDVEEKNDNEKIFSTIKSSFIQDIQQFEHDYLTCQVQKELLDDLFSPDKQVVVDNIQLWKQVFEELLEMFPEQTVSFIYLKAKNKSLGAHLFIESNKIRDEVLNQCRVRQLCENTTTTALVLRMSEILENIQDDSLIRMMFDVIIEHVLTNPTSREHLDCVIRVKRSLFGTTDESKSHLVDLYYWEQLLHVMQIVYFNRQLDMPHDPLLDECAREELANMTTMCVSNMLDHAAISHTNHPDRQPQIKLIVDLIRNSGLYIASRMKQHDPEISWFFIHYIIERTCWYPVKQVRERANICVMVAKLDVPRLRLCQTGCWQSASSSKSTKNRGHHQPATVLLHKDLIRLVHQMLVGG